MVQTVSTSTNCISNVKESYTLDVSGCISGSFCTPPECLVISAHLRDLFVTFYIWNNASNKSSTQARVPCFVCNGLSQWSGRKIDLTDHPWVMMMMGLLLLKPQEVSVCSCRGSSVQLSSPSKNILKTELLTYGSLSLGTTLCSPSTAPRESNGRRVICLFWVTRPIRTRRGTGCVYFEMNDWKFTLSVHLESRRHVCMNASMR